MKKKIMAFVLLICFVFLFAACGNPASGGVSLDSMRAKYRDAGLHTVTLPKSSIDDIAGLKEGFKVYAILHERTEDYEEINNEYYGFRVRIYKFESKSLAEEFVYESKGKYIQTSLKKDVYVCFVNSYSASVQSDLKSLREKVIEIFDSCF